MAFVPVNAPGAGEQYSTPVVQEAARGSAPEKPLPIHRGFPKSHRLLHRADFRAVLRRRCQIRDSYFAVYTTKNSLVHSRLGVTVSRKVSHHAVARNRIKRLMRETYRHLSGKMGGVDIVVIARPAAATATSHELKHSLDRHWSRVITRCGK